MSTTEVLTAVIIHLVIPLIGFLIFLRLVRKMKRAEIVHPPILSWLFIFINYGGLLLISLTGLLWVWSGMATLGMFYLIFGAPVDMGIISYINYKRRQNSLYHKWSYILGILYFVVAPLTFSAFWLLDR